MNNLLVVLIIVLLAAMLAIGFWTARSQKSAEDFLVGGRRFGLLTNASTQIATAFGGAVMLGQVGIGYKYGFSVLIYSSIAAPLGVFLLARFLARWLRRQQFLTTTDWMCQQYGETKPLRALTSVVVSLYSIAAWVAQPIAAGKILNVLTGLPTEWGIVICALVVIVYTMTGGIIAVAYTDVAQLGLMLLAIFVLMPVVVSEAGGIAHILSSVPTENLTLSAAGNSVLLAWLLSIIPAQLVKQTYHQRIFGAKNEDVAVKGLYTLATISCLTGFWAAILGMAIYTLNPSLADEEFATIWALQEVLHPVVAAMALAGLVAAVISSADSALHSVSASMSRDIFQMVLKPDASDRSVLTVSKVCVVVVGIAGIGIGIMVPNVIQALLVGYSLTAAGLFFPLVVGHYWKGATHNGAIAGIIAGVSVTLLFKVVENPIPYLPPVALGLSASAIAMTIISKAGQSERPLF